MKKIMTLALVAMMTIFSYATTVDDLFKTLEDQGGVVMNIPAEMMPMILNNSGSDADVLKKVTALKMGMIENATPTQVAAVKAVTSEGLENFINMNQLLAALGTSSQADPNAGVFMTVDENTEEITSFVVVSVEDGGISVIKIDGRFTFDEMSKLADS